MGPCAPCARWSAAAVKISESAAAHVPRDLDPRRQDRGPEELSTFLNLLLACWFHRRPSATVVVTRTPTDTNRHRNTNACAWDKNTHTSRPQPASPARVFASEACEPKFCPLRVAPPAPMAGDEQPQYSMAEMPPQRGTPGLLRRLVRGARSTLKVPASLRPRLRRRGVGGERGNHPPALASMTAAMYEPRLEFG
mgnify:CR=1 FL=1